MTINVCFELNGMTAEEARQAPVVSAIQEKARAEEAKRQFQKDVETQIKWLTNTLLGEVAEACSHGYTSCEYIIRNPKDEDVMEQAINHVHHILESLGYESYTHFYSYNWRKRSGKYASYSISWTSKKE